MMAGVSLVAIIFLLRLTVSVGTLNGLFFYANIIQANHQAYFPRATMNFLTTVTVISWLNLDLGIEIYFYDGMDINFMHTPVPISILYLVPSWLYHPGLSLLSINCQTIWAESCGSFGNTSTKCLTVKYLVQLLFHSLGLI